MWQQGWSTEESALQGREVGRRQQTTRASSPGWVQSSKGVIPRDGAWAGRSGTEAETEAWVSRPRAVPPRQSPGLSWNREPASTGPTEHCAQRARFSGLLQPRLAQTREGERVRTIPALS